jgi:putative endonuclease
MRRYYVYIMASKSRVLYMGVTNDIWRRVWEHKNNAITGFTSKYCVHRLVYLETFKYIGNAIAREKHLKGWLRERKVALIRFANPTWEDLSEKWVDEKNFINVKVEASAGEKQALRSAQDDKSYKGVCRNSRRGCAPQCPTPRSNSLTKVHSPSSP